MRVQESGFRGLMVRAVLVVGWMLIGMGWAQAQIPFNFTGEVAVVETDAGGSIFAGTSVGTPFSGRFDYGTAGQAVDLGGGFFLFPNFGGTVTVGGTTVITELSFVAVNDNIITETEDVAIINALIGSNLQVGDPVDAMAIGGELQRGNQNFVEFVVLLVILDTSVITDSNLSNFPPPPEIVDLAAISIFEEDFNTDDEIFSATGVLDGFGSVVMLEAFSDIFTFLEGQSLSANVTDNDDLGAGLGSVTLETQPNNGTLNLNSNGSFTYNADGPGTDVFSYSLTDSSGNTAGPARVTITVAPDPNLAVNININPNGDFQQQIDDAIAMANGSNRVHRLRFQPGTYAYSGSSKSVLATPITGRVVMEPISSGVTLRGMGPDSGLWLEVTDGSLEVRSMTLENFGSGSGGAIYAHDGATLVVDQVTLRNNSSSDVGGGINSGTGARTTISGSTFDGNTSNGGGGGLRAESGSSLTLTATTFINNEAGSGGAISLGDGNNECGGGACALIADINDVTLEGNSAQDGGALGVELFNGDRNDSIRIEKGVFADNTATGNGCDVLINDQRSPETSEKIVISDSAFFGTCATSRVEGSVGGFTIVDSTIVHDGTAVRANGPVNLEGTVLTDSSLVDKNGKSIVAKDACEGQEALFRSLGFNVSSDDSCGLDQATDQPATDPRIQRSGKDFSILAGSPILDSGPSELIALLSGEGKQLPCGYKDSEGLGRPQDGDDDGTYECDIGNVELKNGPDVTGATTSAYFDPTRPGEGVFVEAIGGGLAFVAMFTYQIDGSGPVWLVGVGNTVGNTIVVDEMLLTSGGVFGDGFNSNAIVRTPVGGMGLIYRDCSASDKPGRLAFQALLGSPFTDLLVDATRLTTVVGCGQGAAPAEAGRSGSFFDPNRNGEGIFVQWLDDGRVLVIWYTYDPDGRQFWTISGDVQINGSTVTANMLYPAEGTRFGENFNPNEVVLEEWGTLTLDYDGCDSINLGYESSVDGFGSGSYEYSRLTSISGTSCDL